MAAIICGKDGKFLYQTMTTSTLNLLHLLPSIFLEYIRFKKEKKKSACFQDVWTLIVEIEEMYSFFFSLLFLCKMCRLGTEGR